MIKHRLPLVGTLAALLGMLLATMPKPASAGPVVYVAGSNNAFGTINLSTGVFTPIGTVGLAAGAGLNGMGFGADGNLYGADSQSSANLYRIDTATGAATLQGTLGRSLIDVTSDAAGEFYALSQGANATAYTFTPPSTTTTVIVQTGITSPGLSAVSADGTELFTSASSSSGDLLTMINTSTGQATKIGAIGFDVFNGLFVNNVLYGFVAGLDASQDAIITINLTTGMGTKVATYSLPENQSIFASAAVTPFAAPTPEPATLVPAAFAGIAGIVYRIRRRRRTAS